MSTIKGKTLGSSVVFVFVVGAPACSKPHPHTENVDASSTVPSALVQPSEAGPPRVYIKRPRAACTPRPKNYRFEEHGYVPSPSTKDYNRGACDTAGDCKAHSPGECITHERQPPHGFSPPSTCVYDACEKDADCGAGSRCFCGGDSHVNRCVFGNCIENADCGEGVQCRLSVPWSARGQGGALYCETPNDECRKADDCKTPGKQHCMFTGAKWSCVESPPLPPLMPG